MLTDSHFDIAIVGGGMVGGSLAIALQASGLKICLVDASDPNASDPRLIALNYNSKCFFQNNHTWDHLVEAAAPIMGVTISDRGHFGKLRLRAGDVNLAALGFVVPAHKIHNALYKQLYADNKITILRPAQLQKLSVSDTHTILQLTTGQITASLVIGADGNHSTVRKQLDIEVETVDYQQSALVTIAELSRDHEHIAHERFHMTGAVAMLPLQAFRSATILTDSTQNICALMAMDAKDFSKAVHSLFGYTLGRLQYPHARYTYPLQLQKAKQHFKNSVLLVGNAAHNLHPIAAQGFNLAIAEIAKLADIILLQKSDLRSLNLKDYVEWQAQQEINSTQFSHQLPAIFSSPYFLTQRARQLGLVGLNFCAPLRKRFILHAMGRQKNLPKQLLD